MEKLEETVEDIKTKGGINASAGGAERIAKWQKTILMQP